ncbi:unnamed protein product [Heligmosomoides polygyrus]|uniref:KH_dom_type_1 domain-containing protein n=1 Tax=Heligmosomoides polygyrus TaxID=6339 RepID=A0A183FWG4_HELPZ|nr:unnamed protein product [Heligmosomoides polygyrus]
MSTFSARAVQHSINQLLINTINDAEKMLLDLPRDGDRVEVITSSSRGVRVHNMSSSKPGRTTQDVVADKVSRSDSRTPDDGRRGCPRSFGSSIQVSPLRQMEGVSIDLVVMIKMKSGGSRTVNMQIECPHFTPKRIRVDGVWHNIV